MEFLRCIPFMILFLLTSQVTTFAQNDSHVLTIIRIENNGRMNIIPCRIYIFQDQAVLAGVDSKVEDLSGKVQDNRRLARYLLLIGGDTARLKLKPGKYKLFARTMAETHRGYAGDPQRDWESDFFDVTVGGQEQTIYIAPNKPDSGYDGHWYFSRSENDFS